MIVVDERDADAALFAADADFFGDFFEAAVALVMQKVDAVAEADGEVGVAIVIVSRRRRSRGLCRLA